MLTRIILTTTFLAYAAATTSPAHAQATLPANTSKVEQTRQVLEAYWKNHDPKYVAEDAVFIMLPTGEEIKGREAIAKHLDEFYHGSLTAHAEVLNAIFSENKGLLEAVVVGKHTGNFAGIPATGRDVKVPLAVSYDLDGGLIKRARIYLMVNVLVNQISSPANTQHQ
jgi:hypothetical protein